MQDVLEKSKKPTYFKLTLPNTGDELTGAIWASGPPTQFLLHVCPAIYACKQIRLDANFAEANANLDLVIANSEYSSKKKKIKEKRVKNQLQVLRLRHLSLPLPR